ncbi:hypothetical protein C8R44DRAFT_886290 [Mycena epipterygia]|nr:hypothetical protein C8R44DRAFT_886290 [Mycena epipterygia]
MFAPRSPPPSTLTSFASLVFPTSDSDATPPADSKPDLGKSVIEWLFVVIAVILIGCLFLRKLLGAPRGLHGENPYRHALHPFASSTSISAAPDYLQYGYGYAYLPYPVPAHTTRRAYGVTHPTRRAHDTTQTTRAYDIGVGGRRANGDEELVLGDKDILPVYDAFDRPPQYAYGYDAGPSVNVEPVAVGEGGSEVEGQVEALEGVLDVHAGVEMPHGVER